VRGRLFKLRPMDLRALNNMFQMSIIAHVRVCTDDVADHRRSIGKRFSKTFKMVLIDIMIRMVFISYYVHLISYFRHIF